MAKNKPVDFKDLDAAELYRAAIEDFAVPVEEADKGKKKVLLAALVESGVAWADYVVQHPEVAPSEEEAAEVELKEKLATGQVVTSDAPAPEPVVETETVEAVVVPRVIVKEEIQVNTPDKYLIKMTRKNPLYQVRGYTFTQKNPYNLVNADDANFILSKEDGFAMATPAELQEFYS